MQEKFLIGRYGNTVVAPSNLLKKIIFSASLR
jgi:hypothetical protein